MSAAGRTVLVTGAAGLVGARSCRVLTERGWKVRALVRDRATAAARLRGVAVEFTVGDLRDHDLVRATVAGADAIVHLAAIAIERAGQTYEAVNTDATAALLEAARAGGVNRFIQMSQNGASSASPHRFLKSKGIAEDLVRASDRSWTVLRPSVIFGPGDEFVTVLARLVRLSPVVYPLPGGGTARFQPVSVNDVAESVALSLEQSDTGGRAFTLGGPEPLSLREIAARVLEAMEARRALVGVPAAVLRPLVGIAQLVLPSPPVTTGLLALLDNDNVTPDNALAPVFGITPTPFTAENLGYLREITAGDAARSLFRR